VEADGRRTEHGLHARHGVPVADVLHPHFRPPPWEGQIGLRLPPATVVVPGKDKIGEEDKKPVNPKGIHTLTISVFSDNGTIDSMGVGEQQTKTLHDLDVKLQQVFKDPNNPSIK